MRLALITQEEPFYLPPALEVVCAAWKGQVVALIILPAFNEPLPATAKRLYDFYGGWDFLRLTQRYAWAKLANLLNRVAVMTRPYSAADVARRYSVPLYRPLKVNAPEFVTTLQNEIRPDLLVSVAASQILKSHVLRVPPLGCINLHSAPLPRYQGMMPNFWTLVHGEPEAMVTVHYMTEKLDAGDIILQEPVPIHREDSLHDLMARSKQIGAQVLLEAIEQIERGTVRPQPMDTNRASYFSFPKRADAQRLRAQGRKLL